MCVCEEMYREGITSVCVRVCVYRDVGERTRVYVGLCMYVCRDAGRSSVCVGVGVSVSFEEGTTQIMCLRVYVCVWVCGGEY